MRGCALPDRPVGALASDPAGAPTLAGPSSDSRRCGGPDLGLATTAAMNWVTAGVGWRP